MRLAISVERRRRFGAWCRARVAPLSQRSVAVRFAELLGGLLLSGGALVSAFAFKRRIALLEAEVLDSSGARRATTGWLLLALVTTLTLSHFDAAEFGVKVALVGVFMAVSWFGVRPLIKQAVRRTRHHGHLSPHLMGILLAAIFLCAMTTYKLGIFAIFGGFVMGVLVHDEHELVAAWKERIGHFVTVFFLPIFFTYTGLRTNIGGLDSAALWGWCILTTLLATAGKFGGSYLAARACGLNHAESSVLGIMMNTRALMELIVINVGFDLGVISQDMFTMLVLMAIVSTVVTTPGLRRWLPKMGVTVNGRR